jgi:hypothetical protein
MMAATFERGDGGELAMFGERKKDCTEFEEKSLIARFGELVWEGL